MVENGWWQSLHQIKGKIPANALLVKSFKLQRISKRPPLFCQVQNFSSNQSFSAPAQWLLMSSLRKELKKSLHPYNVQVCKCESVFRNWRNHCILTIVVLVTLPALMMNQSTVISPQKGDNLCLPTFVALFSWERGFCVLATNITWQR